VPRLLKIKDLEQRKKALAEESDIYRETLKIQVQNLRLYGVRARRRFSVFSPSNPLMMLATPFAWAFIGKRRFPKVRFITAAIIGWKLFRAARSVFPGLFGGGREDEPEMTEEEPTQTTSGPM